MLAHHRKHYDEKLRQAIDLLNELLDSDSYDDADKNRIKAIVKAQGQLRRALVVDMNWTLS